LSDTQARPGATPPLWRLLQAAAGVVQAVGEGASATPALAGVAPELRAGTQALVFQALRQMGRAQALRAQLARRAPPPPHLSRAARSAGVCTATCHWCRCGTQLRCSLPLRLAK